MILLLLAQITQPTQLTPEWVVGILIAAITALAGFIVFLIKTRVPAKVYEDIIGQYKELVGRIDESCAVLRELGGNQSKVADLISINSQMLASLSAAIENLTAFHDKTSDEMRGALDKIKEIKIALDKHHEMYMEFRRMNGIHHQGES